MFQGLPHSHTSISKVALKLKKSICSKGHPTHTYNVQVEQPGKILQAKSQLNTSIESSKTCEAQKNTQVESNSTCMLNTQSPRSCSYRVKTCKKINSKHRHTTNTHTTTILDSGIKFDVNTMYVWVKSEKRMLITQSSRRHITVSSNFPSVRFSCTITTIDKKGPDWNHASVNPKYQSQLCKTGESWLSKIPELMQSYSFDHNSQHTHTMNTKTDTHLTIAVEYTSVMYIVQSWV